MNDRIKECIKQAEDYAGDHYDRFRDTLLFNNLRDITFAELIIKEVAKVIWKAEPKPFAIIFDINKHFGIKQ
jgi:hypothetical protein